MRPLQVKPGEGVNLRDRSSIPVAFAVWDGDNQERDEAEEKMVEWLQMKF